MYQKTASFTTDGSGNATVNIALTELAGRPGVLWAVRTKHSALDATADTTFTCVNTQSGDNFAAWVLQNKNLDQTFYPRVVEHDQVGADLTTRIPPLIEGNFSITIAQGGANKAGKLTVYYSDL